MSLSKYEQETIVSFNAEEDVMDIYSADPVWIRKLQRLAEAAPELYRLKEIIHDREGNEVARSYTAPKPLLTLRSKIPTSTMSDEEKAKRREQMLKLRSSQLANGGEK